MSGIIVLFPGLANRVDIPMLYYAGKKYAAKRYECVRINYDGRKKIDEITAAVTERLGGIEFSIYNDILFVSKSIGTIVASRAADELGINARHIFLTPIRDTLRYIRKDRNIQLVVAGTDDEFIDIEPLRERCLSEGVRLELVEGAGHGLEVSDDVGVNIEVLKRVVGWY
jgi:hypothetical protein